MKLCVTCEYCLQFDGVFGEAPRVFFGVLFGVANTLSAFPVTKSNIVQYEAQQLSTKAIELTIYDGRRFLS